MENFKNNYYVLEVNIANSMLVYTSFPESENMEEEDLKDGFLKTTEMIEKYKPQFFLSDSRQQNSAISPEIQVWIAQNIYPRWYKAGLKKLAIVIPQELIANLSIEQVVDEIEIVKEANAYEIRYFESDTTAKEWLK